MRIGEHVSLPLARAALGAGELAVAKAAAQARVEAGSGPAWVELLARVQIAEGHDRAALETLRGSLDAGADREAVSAESIWLLAVLGVRLGALREIQPLLAAADPWLVAEAGLDDTQRGDVFWIRAEAARKVGFYAVARRDYQSASAHLAAGPRRASAEYWLGVLADDPEREREHYGAGESADPGGLWATLAGEELALSRLRERYGRPEALTR